MLPCIAGIYVITCFIPDIRWLYLLVVMHGFLVGIFWTMFWVGFYRKQGGKSVKLSTVTILSTACSMIGSYITGKLYLTCGKYVLFLFAGLLIAVVCLLRPLEKIRFGGVHEPRRESGGT